MAIQSEYALAPNNLPHQKENAEHAMVPFEPNFQEDELSDMDLLSAICEVSDEISINTTTSTVSNTSNVVNTTPRAMFANCHIGAINITINKK